MKYIRSTPPWLLVLALAAMLFPACASLETNAYRSIGATTTLVDSSMQAWGDYVRAGQATVADELRVRAAYGNYQAVMRRLQIAVTDYRANGNRTPLEQALAACETTAADLVKLIRDP